MAMLNVLPEPVTPSNVWCASPASMPSTIRRIASGWSPAGSKRVTSWNSDMKYLWVHPYAVKPDRNEKDRKRPTSPEEKTGLCSMWSRLPSLSRQTSYIP
ncbi:hypothetical protein EMIT0P44_350039 [Pseudomonas sp. IT-P44]